MTKSCHPTEDSEQLLSVVLPGHGSTAEAAQRRARRRKQGVAAYCSGALKIQLLGNTKSEFTSIKQKLSISHSSIIKY